MKIRPCQKQGDDNFLHSKCKTTYTYTIFVFYKERDRNRTENRSLLQEQSPKPSSSVLDPSPEAPSRVVVALLLLLVAIRTAMEDEVKALLALVNKLQPAVADPVHSSELKLVSFFVYFPRFALFRVLIWSLPLGTHRSRVWSSLLQFLFIATMQDHKQGDDNFCGLRALNAWREAVLGFFY